MADTEPGLCMMSDSWEQHREEHIFAWMRKHPCGKGIYVCLSRTLAFCALMLSCGLSNAATYNLPAGIGTAPFNTCTFSAGTTYNCTGSITITNNNTINVTSPMTLVMTTGSFTGNNNITITSNGNAFTIDAPLGSITFGNSLIANTVNLQAATGTITTGSNATITGNLSATTLNLGTGTVVNGACTPTNAKCTSTRTISIANASVAEGNAGTTNLNFSVTLSASSGLASSANYATSAGTATAGASCTAGVDYITKSGTVSIPAGSTTATITVQICGDTNVESDETFTVTLSAPTNATLGTSAATGTIINDDGAVGPDHLEIQHVSGTGLTCAASTLTIRACANAACTTPYTGGVSGTLSATGAPTVIWDGATGGAAGAGFVIPNGSSSVTKNVQVATAGSVVFGISSPTPAPTSATTCNFGTPACTFTANTAGFIFSNTTTGSSYTIPAQVSGITSPTLYLRAVQAATTNPAVCTPAIISSTTPVNMGYACNNPTTCQAGSLTTINATAIAGSPNSNPTQNSTSVSLVFDANGSAPITVRYDDVGQITLYANKTVTPFAGGAAITLTGNSNPFVVAPHHFGFSGITTGPIKAGNNFSATVTAYNGLATPTATANFGRETTPEGVTLTRSLVSPAGGNNPVLANNVIAGGTFASGAATVNNLSWGDVGILTLTANLTNSSYLLSGLTATGTSGNVGSFIPDHLDTAVVAGCVAGSFTYSGQPYAVQVTARNSAGGITQNYNTACGYSKNVTLSNAGSAANLNIGWPPPGTPTQTMSSTQFTNPATCGGVMSPLTGPSGTQNNVTYTFAAPTVPATVTMRAVDTDSVTSSGFTEGSTEIRSGRVKLSGAYGSELLQLSIPIALQYYASNGWVPNTADTCSAISAGNFAFSSPGNNLASCETAMTASGSAPNYTLRLAAPGSGNNGWTDLTLNLGATATGNTCTSVGGVGPPETPASMPWLQYPAGTNPTARATFGVYKGNSSFIYLRENY